MTSCAYGPYPILAGPYLTSILIAQGKLFLQLILVED
jgi:hypothetical protein